MKKLTQTDETQREICAQIFEVAKKMFNSITNFEKIRVEKYPINTLDGILTCSRYGCELPQFSDDVLHENNGITYITAGCFSCNFRTINVFEILKENLKLLPANERAQFTVFSDVEKFDCSDIAKFCGCDDFQPNMQNVEFNYKRGTKVATDAHILKIVRIEKSDKETVIINPKTNEIKETPLPNYMEVLPKSGAKVVLNLIEIIKSIPKKMLNQRTKQVIFNFRADGYHRITGCDSDFGTSFEQVFYCNCEFGQNFRIGFNYGLLSKILSYYKGKNTEFTMYLTASNRAVIITVEGKTDINLIMPVMIENSNNCCIIDSSYYVDIPEVFDIFKSENETINDIKEPVLSEKLETSPKLARADFTVRCESDNYYYELWNSRGGNETRLYCYKGDSNNIAVVSISNYCGDSNNKDFYFDLINTHFAPENEAETANNTNVLQEPETSVNETKDGENAQLLPVIYYLENVKKYNTYLDSYIYDFRAYYSGDAAKYIDFYLDASNIDEAKEKAERKMSQIFYNERVYNYCGWLPPVDTMNDEESAIETSDIEYLVENQLVEIVPPKKSIVQTYCNMNLPIIEPVQYVETEQQIDYKTLYEETLQSLFELGKKYDEVTEKIANIESVLNGEKLKIEAHERLNDGEISVFGGKPNEYGAHIGGVILGKLDGKIVDSETYRKHNEDIIEIKKKRAKIDKNAAIIDFFADKTVIFGEDSGVTIDGKTHKSIDYVYRFIVCGKPLPKHKKRVKEPIIAPKKDFVIYVETGSDEDAPSFNSYEAAEAYIIENNLTVERDEVCNDFIIIYAKKAEIDALQHFENELKNGIVTFNYRKTDGTIREACGTLKPELLPELKIKDRQFNTDLFVYFDVEKQQFRTFKRDNFIGIITEKTAQIEIECNCCYKFMFYDENILTDGNDADIFTCEHCGKQYTRIQLFEMYVSELENVSC